MVARVSSVLPPSTKMSSVRAPSFGVRAMMAGTLPASLRAGTTTVTDGGVGGGGRLVAAAQHVEAVHAEPRMTGSLAT
jgi:hypothetical protein